MGERKVLNKYFPPDFDPAKIPRRRKSENNRMTVRMMLPMSVRCKACGNFIYKGTKFNSRKEDVIGESYLNKIPILRFSFNCPNCSSEITYRTDPKNSDYAVESGASRNFEPWREEDEMREDAETGDALKALENRTLDSKREIDVLAALDEMKSMNSRRARLIVDAMLQALQSSNGGQQEKKLEEEDEAIVRSIVFHSSPNFVRRIEICKLNDEYEDYEVDDLPAKRRKTCQETEQLSKAIKMNSSKIKAAAVSKPATLASGKVVVDSALQSLCQNYESSDDE